ncbi:hypothetical protein KCU61_g279, partial [Aureobasidium melanogenum]
MLYVTRSTLCCFCADADATGERVRIRIGRGRYINHHVLYLDEGANETWETFIIISSRHREDRGYGEGDAVPNAQNAECRMRLGVFVRYAW